MQTDCGLKKFTHGEILYVRQDGRNIEIETLKGLYIIRGKKVTSTENIRDCRFFRCNTYVIVNISLIERIDKNEIFFVNDKPLALGDKSTQKIIKYLKDNFGYCDN